MRIFIKKQLGMKKLPRLFIWSVYTIGLICWFYLHFTSSVNNLINYWLNVPMGLSPLIIGLVLCITAWQKSYKFSLNKHALYFGFYLFFWGLATILTLYYNVVLQINAPFPSLLDIFYIVSQIFLLISTFKYLSIIRQWVFVKDIGQKILFFGTAPIIQLVLYWYVMQVFSRDVFPNFDLQYMSSMISLVLNIIVFIVLYIFAFVLFFQKNNKTTDALLGWLLIIGITMQYVSDYYFIILLAHDAFYVGHFVDFMFMTTYFYMSLIGLRIYKNLQG